MTTHYEFGKETKELELARMLQRRKMARRALSIGMLLLAAVLIFAFRNNIQDVFGTSGKNDSGQYGGKKRKLQLPAATVDIKKQWDLPAELLEISGISWLEDNRVACVQDEDGVIFFYDLQNSRVEKKIPFGGAGDYEGLAIVGDAAWILRSDGTLFEVASFTGTPSVKEYDTPLSAEHNTEGLCYDAKNNRLLIALKDGEPGNKDQKGIYSFSLSAGKMEAEPVMTLDMNALSAGEKTSGKKKGDKAAFMPSAIGIHPVTGEIYITEGRKPRLLILDPSGNVKQFTTLDKDIFNQPEGITFSPEGEIFISNEGSKKPGNILQVQVR